MPFGTNSGAKFSGNDGVVKLIESPAGGETPATIVHVAGFNLTESVIEIETNELGSDWQDALIGQKIFKGTVKLFKGKVGEILRAGLYQCAFTYEDSATDGTITGRFILNEVKTDKTVNSATTQEFSVRSVGTVTVVAAVGS